MRSVVALFAAVLLASCGSDSYALPDRTDPEVQARETELSPVVALAEGAEKCEVRFLGESDGASFVWAECFGPDGGSSGPFRVEGATVEAPQDGGQFADDVQRLFPEPLSDAILGDPERLHP